MALSAGTRLGPYEILEPLGAGGMGEVYKANDTRLDRTLAIKLLRPESVGSPERKRRFISEAKAASALNHPNIITIYDIGTTPSARGEVDFIAMEYVPGTSLQDRIAAKVAVGEGLPLEEGLHYAVQIAEALAAVHAVEIVHRDIKPANIMVTETGRVKMLDFGLAKLLERGEVDESASTLAEGARTEEGAVLGTAAYMSPEQAEGIAVDARSDIFSFGIVLYELLAGRRPFQGDSQASMRMSILRDNPPPLKEVARSVPVELGGIVGRCLAKEKEARYPTGNELLKSLTRLQASHEGTKVELKALLKQPRFAAPIAIVLLVGFLVGAGLWVKSSRVRWVHTVALPEATRLVDEGQNYAAFRLLRQAEAYVPDDPILKQVLVESTTPVTVRTTPAGAQVYIRDFFDEPDAWELLGSAPLDELRLPTATLVWKISLEGFQTRKALGFTGARTFDFSLQPAAEAPDDMVHVRWSTVSQYFVQHGMSPGGRYDEFWIDTYEVANRQFKEFVDQGGYEQRKYWSEPVVKDGVVLNWQEARQLFRDRTGQPGPATWELGTFPDGQGDYPVGGISWYEAAAYCASVGKQLPTVYHWYQAADWRVAVTEFVQFSHFEADGPAKVGHPLRLGARGTYDMAGNVKEWCRNEADATRRYILGGGWNEPSYQFHTHDAQPPSDREPIYGVRCVKYRVPLPAAQTGRIAARSRDWRRETPVGDDVFAVYQSLYGYDRTPLEPSVDPEREQFEHWSVEHVSFAAAYGNERVPAWLFLPKNALPPYQTVVYFPGVEPFLQRTSPEEVDADRFLFLVRSGRAVLFPVYKGMYERPAGPFLLPHVWRDLVIQSAKDLRRAVDYLETRPDMDAQKLAYLGLSMGAALGPIMTAVEPRLKASILLGGGLYSWQRPPESEAIHFLPRIKVPTLMINGRHDFFFPWETSQVPMFELLGMPPADKRHRVFESGHVPTERHEIMKEALDWLDRYLDPVTRR